jgi:hypothetical protein
LKTLSRTTKSDSALQRGGAQLTSWKRWLSREQIDRILSVVNAFGLTNIYDVDSLPNYSSLDAGSHEQCTISR